MNSSCEVTEDFNMTIVHFFFICSKSAISNPYGGQGSIRCDQIEQECKRIKISEKLKTYAC